MDNLSSNVLNKILAACGPGKILYYGANPRQVVRALLRHGADAFGVTEFPSPADSLAASVVSAKLEALPFREDAFDTLIVRCTANETAFTTSFAVLSELRRVCRRYLILVAETECGPLRATWEERAFGEGFRKHPAYYRITNYEALQNDLPPLLIPLEKMATSVVTNRPLEGLLAERPLHMDMSRETGPRSDAHMARYDLAAQWVRAGDRVLDCACGLGYGTAMLANLSAGRCFLGVDLSAAAVDYARECFAFGECLSFQQGDATDLAFIADGTVDMLVSFETMEHLPDYGNFMREARRILKPDGRIILSVPNLWCDETGNDPNPYHFHVFDLEKITSTLTAVGFIVEARYAQSAPGGFRLLDAPRSLERRPLNKAPVEPDTEWWILVASVNPLGPLGGKGVPYAHPDFDRSAIDTGFLVTDFARYYDNPWLYRPLVQMGERLADTTELNKLAQLVLETSDAVSADFGAALTVIGYQLFDCEVLDDHDLTDFLSKACDYRAQTTSNPHVHRWQVSIGYLSAQLALRAGQRKQALGIFSSVAATDVLAFSPLLATKTVAASFWAGIIQLVDGDSTDARRNFENGIECARRALHAPDKNAIGNPTEPLSFGFPELAEIADMAGQCVNALRNLEFFDVAPGKFWRAVEVRRFGFATWALGLERELSHQVEIGRRLRYSIDSATRERTVLARYINTVLERLTGFRLVRSRVLKRFSDRVQN